MNMPDIRKIPRYDVARRGMALFIVLAVLVLISTLVIAFFLSTTTELKSSQSYASGASAKQLAESATQLVIAQIADATKGHDEENAPLAWASQPGMIRTYDQSGNPVSFYKLYSSDSLILGGTAASGFNATAEATSLSGWDNTPGLFTDLNSPIIRDNKVSFPIIDPRAKAVAVSQSIEGFDYSASVNGVMLPGAAADGQRLPMPVRWLYVLQNGKLATPATSSGGVVAFNASDPAHVPSAQNPIVGRIAFWTDDDTCKVNINTASEGTFWDRPWVNNTTEQHFATAIPGQNEFQRFPGHPAKTCLSTIFGPLLPSPNPVPAWIGTTATNQSQLKAYYDLVSRVADGGTKGGSINENNPNGSVNSSFSSITPDADRLYASIDEIFYNPSRSPNMANLDNIFLEKAKFFLTAHNRSPELNLFGKPRITLWPLQANTANVLNPAAAPDRNAKDKLIAFCSTINNLPYYFQRYNAYTDPGVAPSSVGGSTRASSQSATLDWANVRRNQTLYSYLDSLTSQNIPGFGGSFDAKYPDTRRQLLTEMFDMVRSGVNSYNSSYNYVPTYLDPGEGQVIPIQPENGTQGFGRTTTIVGASLVFFRANVGSCTSTNGTVTCNPSLITPMNPSGVVITPAAQIGATLLLNPYTPSPGLPPLNPNLQYVVSGLDRLEISSLSTNHTRLPFPAGDLTNTVTARSEFSGGANCTPFFGVVSSLRYAGDVGRGTSSSGDATKTFGTTDPVKQYPFTTPVGTGVSVGALDTTFNFLGGPITIKIYAGSDTAHQHLLQEITMNFDAVNGLPIPTSDPGTTIDGTTTYPNNYPKTAFEGYMARVGGGGAPTQRIDTVFRNDGLIQSHPIPNVSAPPPLSTWWANWLVKTTLGKDSNGNPVTYWVQDVARGVEADPNRPAKGDLRIYAALPKVTADYFRACKAPDGSAAYDFPAGGPQQYTNVQTLRDEGADGSGTGGFGCDNSPYPNLASYSNASVSGVPYPHYPYNVGGSVNGSMQLLLSTFTTGVLIPKNKLAQFGGTDGWGSFTGAQEYRATARPATANGLASAQTSGGYPGDWDNMTGLLEDGAFINKPDEGNGSTVSNTANVSNVDTYYGTLDISGGYFSKGFSPSMKFFNIDPITGGISTFSPNRQVSSAVMFGSLSTGIDPAGNHLKPWQTLLFCAHPSAGSNHPGFGTPASGPPYTMPPDHLMLDLFTMPIVEPYAISEPFSTAGKINMNYQIMPFTYIRRDTGVRAVLKSTRIMAIPQSASTAAPAASYKEGTRCKYEMRYNINPDETAGTLAGFEARFNNNDIFRSASEICGISLVPQQIPALDTGMSYPPGATPPASYAATAAWWANFQLTGDNTREFPYGDIYARLTTKSNTYTVHYKVQTLKKVSTTPANQWIEGKDQVTGETRGSTTVERYIDLGNSSLPDFASSSAPSAEDFYKIRIIDSTIFNP